MRHATYTETLSAKTATLSIQNTCCVESCYVVAAATYMPTSLVSLPTTPLLFKHTFWLSVLLLDGYLLDSCHSLSACLSSFCPSILHLCWLCASLATIPTGMVSHYQPCLVLLCLTISHACWCGVSILAVPARVVSHLKPCILVLCFTISHACWCGASL